MKEMYREYLKSFFAEFIANDKPILLKYDGEYYFPIFKVYTDARFGGDFPMKEWKKSLPYFVKRIKELIINHYIFIHQKVIHLQLFHYQNGEDYVP